MSTETKDDGGPAFPVLYGQTNGADGMTLRDWFAGHALAGECAAQETAICGTSAARELAVRCYAMADAMLAARKDGRQ